MTGQTKLLGFESDAGLRELLARFRVFQDYKETLPAHLLGILQQQHASTVIESIELLRVPNCEVGGLQHPDGKALIKVQTLRAPLDLRLILLMGAGRFELDIQLIFICEGLDSSATVKSDMLIKTQKRIE